jgi:hypothetical protein
MNRSEMHRAEREAREDAAKRDRESERDSALIRYLAAVAYREAKDPDEPRRPHRRPA